MRSRLLNTPAGGFAALVSRILTGGEDRDLAVTALGTSSQANSYGLKATMTTVTAGGANTGVRLPSGVNLLSAGDEIDVYNTKGSALLIYPEVGGNINNAGADTAYSLANNTRAIIKCWTPGVYSITV
jgi:hypothetical protein